MDDLSILAFYKLCSDCNLPGIIDTFGNLSDTTNIDMEYAYYMVYSSHPSNNNNNSLFLEWLLKLDPTINHDTIINDYMADEHIPNHALFMACVAGHYNVAKCWCSSQIDLRDGSIPSFMFILVLENFTESQMIG